MTLSIIERKYRTMILEYVLLAVLLLSAVFIIVAVVFQKSADEGLSGTIAGNETFYGKEKSAHTDKLWFRLTLIVSIVFVAAVLLVYIIQPDYDGSAALDDWKQWSDYYNQLK